MTSRRGADQPPIRGVNLGGWLVLEKWLTPSLFSGLEARDEYGFCQELGEAAAELLDIHRRHFITRDDFVWLKAHGIEAVRLPVGFWVFGDEPPFVATSRYVDLAFTWAEELGLAVLLDLHAAPGSQNGRVHSGQAGSIHWPERANRARTLEVLEALAERYGRRPALMGISLLNEPSRYIGHRRLGRFYKRAYQVVRAHSGDNVAVVFSDAFRPRRWSRVLPTRRHANVLLDLHLYQIYGRREQGRDIGWHLDRALAWRSLIGHVQRRSHPVIVGEWSAALPQSTLGGQSLWQQMLARRGYADAQILAFRQAHAWFYWTYRTEEGGAWSYRRGVEQGWLPAHY